MTTSIYTPFRGRVRIYDGTPTTPQFLLLPWVQPDLRSPLVRPRPAMNLRLNRGLGDTFTHYTRDSDDPIFSPVAVTFTSYMDEQLYDDVVRAICNPFDDGTWMVGTATFLTAAGTGATIRDGTSRAGFISGR